MAKKLLNEATVRRFQSLANLKPLNEMSYKRDEEEKEEKMEEAIEEGEETLEETYMEADEEKEEMKEAYMEADEEPGDAPEAPEMPEMDGGADLDDVELTDEEAEALIALGEKLAAAMGDKGEEMEMDDAPEMPDMMEEEEINEEDELMETLSEIDYVPSQTEIVNEVARRVARRLAEAQKAEKRMNEALGRK